jgi:hypothetical protein
MMEERSAVGGGEGAVRDGLKRGRKQRRQPVVVVVEEEVEKKSQVIQVDNGPFVAAKQKLHLKPNLDNIKRSDY